MVVLGFKGLLGGCYRTSEVGDKDDISYDDTTVERGKMTTWRGS